MTAQPTPEDPAWAAKRRRAGIVALLTGAAMPLAFFSFFPASPTSSTGAPSSSP
ncbi:hypothetical protein ACTVZO_20000 [Streptomyces sp. IBSNAI002]|uniref:hypothetical protein n=1 Tax=Streptomyces sp. IBSNAI002 TaxID=3457500 RepID=UPI003FD2B6DD